MNEAGIRRGIRWKLMIALAVMILPMVVLLTVLQVTGLQASLKNALETHSAFLEEQVHRKAESASGRIAAHIEKLIATRRIGLAKAFIREEVGDIENLRYAILMQGARPKVAVGTNLDDSLRRFILSGDISSYASAQKQSMHHDFEIEGHAFMESVVPVFHEDMQWGVLRLGFSLDELNATLADSNRFISDEIGNALIRAILISLLFLVLGGFIIYFFARKWTGPIRRLVDFSHELAGGDFSATPHISTRTDDEIGMLVTALEEMAESLRLAHEQQEEYSHTLEEQVEKRTRELEQARDRALAATQAKSEFLANMSHEIRTPINAVVGLTHLALDRETDRQQIDYLTKTLEASEALLSVINDVLDFSKIEANKLEMDSIDFEIDEVMHNLASIGGVRASEKGLDFLIDVPTEMPRLKGDPYRLGQVLLNLVNNAVKFTETGQIIVAVRQHEESDGDITLRFTVTDSGIGMNKEQQQRLFKAFSQADSSITRQFGGTGLGLAICKQLVELMGGEIGLDSIPGKGSCFYFTARFEHGQQPERETIELPSELENLRVLIVDDNPTSKVIIARYAEVFGFRSEQASTAAEAAEMLRGAADDPFGLLVVDWTLAEMSGLESLANIRELAGLSGDAMPPAFLTASFGQQIDEDDLFAAGFAALMQKPLTMASVMRTAREVLGQESDDNDSEVTRQQRLPVEKIAHLKGSRLLLVEDNEINQMVAEGLLIKAGISLTIAHNGQQAVEAVEQDVFDGVLMDMQMPVMDGLEATRLIRKRFSVEQLPVIAMTANAMAQDIENCLAAGMNDHIAKPVDPLDLYEKLDRWIESSRVNVAGIASAEQEEVAALPEIDCVNIDEGLKRVGGDRALYRKVLAKFVESQSGAIRSACEKIEQDDIEGARLVIHSLKGVAGNIGAQSLYRHAAGLEQSIRADESMQVDAVAAAEQELDCVVRTLQSALADDEGEKAEDVSVDTGLAARLLAEMRSLLEDHNGDAVDLMDELAGACGDPDSREHLALLKQRLDAYDFEGALAELDVIEAAISD